MANRSSAHRRAQKEGKLRDGYICQVCGSNKIVEGHHILDHQYLGAATADNIISLCHDCHTNVHRGNIDITKF